MRKKLIIGLITVLLVIAMAVTITICVLPKVNIYAENLTVEFDGLPHKIEATVSAEGELSYEYVGIDNDYRSAVEPTQAGEYDVQIRFKSLKKNTPSTNKKVKLTITLPYSLDETGTKISAYVGKQRSVVLPTTYKNKTITSIADNTFKDSNIISVKMPNTKFNVNPNAFNGCNVEKLIIHEKTKLLDGQYPNGLELEFYGKPKTIFNDTFGEIIGVEELNLPSSVKEIETDALSKIKVSKLSLYSNLSLKDKKLSETIKLVKVHSDSSKKLADSIFENCVGIEKIEIGEGIDSFGEKAFYNCSSLTELVINSVPTAIGESCFSEEFVLKNLTFQQGLKLNDLGLKMIEAAKLANCEKMTGGEYANCTALKKIILPNTLKSIGDSAFSGCSNLSEVVFPENLEIIESYAFQNCTSLITLTIPQTTTTILAGAFSGCTNLKTINLPHGLKKISDSTFYNCSSLGAISLPDTVLAIESHAFSYCKSLKKIDLPENLESIGMFAFSDCSSMTEITLPASVKLIAEGAFYRFTKKITIPSTTMPKFEGNFFATLLSDCIVYVPSELLSDYRSQFPNTNFEAIS